MVNSTLIQCHCKNTHFVEVNTISAVRLLYWPAVIKALNFDCGLFVLNIVINLSLQGKVISLK